MRTSAIIPTFNRPEYLKECLIAVKCQYLFPDEIIVVDDGSDGSSESIVRSLIQDVKFLRQENAGKSAALNKGIAASSGDLVWIIDDDDVPLPHCLETLKTTLICNEADLVYGRHARFKDFPNGKRQIFDTGYWKDCDPKDFFLETLLDFFAHQPGMLVRKELYEIVGQFDEDLIRSQDYEMTIRLARIAKASGTNEIVFLQRQHAGSRGKSHDQFVAEQVWDRWILADAAIFRALYETLPLQSFLPGSRIKTDRDEIISLLYRASTMARKKLWDLALYDWREASVLASRMFRPDEIEVIKLALCGKYGIDEIVDNPSNRAHFANLYIDPIFKPVRQALARGILWRVREAVYSGQTRKALRLSKIAIQLAS